MASGASPAVKDMQGQDLSLEVTHLQLFLIVMGKLMSGKIPLNWWKFGSSGLTMGMLTCQDKPFFSCTFRYALDRVGKPVYRWGCVNLPNFMWETGFTESLSLASLPHQHHASCWQCPLRAGWASGRCTGRGWQREPGCLSASKTHLSLVCITPSALKQLRMYRCGSS